MSHLNREREHSLVRMVLIKALYDTEGLTLTKADEERIESAELWTMNQLD